MTAAAKDDDAERGRDAQTPRRIPAIGWRDVLWRVKAGIASHHIVIIAAGVAFYALFAIFPALAAMVTIYGLVADPGDVRQLLDTAARGMPAEARTILQDQLDALAGASGQALGFGLILSLGVALWSANAGMKAMIEALNIAYGETDSRGFIRFTLVAFALTLATIALLLVALGVIVAIPILLAALDLPGPVATLANLARWPLLGLVALLLLSAIYRYAPDRHKAGWRWVTPGALIAVVLWILASLGFSYYVANFGEYNEVYGALGAVVILMMWLFITSLCFIVGGMINAELERQTRRDSTTGEELPMGERGARAADTLGGQP